MHLRILKPIAGGHGAYGEGDIVYDVGDVTAAAWIEAGLAVEFELDLESEHANHAPNRPTS